ncbi:hypothetical protein SprV_0602226400 [Sparganum proliferum]
MSSKIIGTLLLLSQVVCGNDNGLTPREFTATALNSSAIRLTWKKPSRPENLSEQYELAVSNEKHEENFRAWGTEYIVTDLEPSTTYNSTVQAVWKNSTPVDAIVSTSATTGPPEASTPLASESSREEEAEGDLPSTEESPAALVDLHNESSSDKSLSSFTDQPPEVRKEGEATEEENTIVDDKEELPSDSHTSNPNATDTELSETDEIQNKLNETFSSESPDKPNSSEVIKGSFISLAGFSLLWLSLMFAI